MHTAKININLKYNKAFKWYTNNTVFFKGYFYIDNVFYQKNEALNYISKLKEIEISTSFIKKINGVFTIMIHKGDSLLLISDVTRSFPIFYSYAKSTWLFSDDINYLKNTVNVNYDHLSEIEFKASNHIHGSKTLIENIFQTQSSEFLFFKNDEIKKRNFYFSYSIHQEFNLKNKELKKQTIFAFENSFKRLINSLQKRTVVIPLSAGFDSRFIAVMLKKYNYTNVICYTYGRKDSFEIKNSKKTAESLNFQWYFIEYNAELLENFIDNIEFKKYIHFAGKMSAMPNLQEYFAVKYLKENNLISEDAIFIPGYAGDILGGSEYLKTIPKKINNKKLSKIILEKKMINHPFSKADKTQLLAEIDKNLFLFDNKFHEKILETVLDDYNLKERITKFIFNSANFYTFFGFEFRFPFWDMELLDFFKYVPNSLKRNKALFDEVLISEYFKKFNVHFEREIQPTKNSIKTQKIKDKIKPFFPTFIKQKFLEKNDWNNYKPITEQMILKMNEKGLKIDRKSNDYNEIVTQWYLYFCKNLLK